MQLRGHLTPTSEPSGCQAKEMWDQLFIYIVLSSKPHKICRGMLVTWQKCLSRQSPPPAALCFFLAEVIRLGPGCHQRLGRTRAPYNTKLLMLRSWLGAMLAYSPECLAEVPAGHRGILPFPLYLPTVPQSLCSLLARPRAAIPMYRLELVPRRAGPPSLLQRPSELCSARGPLCLQVDACA